MVDELESAISADRFQRYLRDVAGDRGLALELYRLNLRVSAEFLPGLHWWGVVLRNRIDAVLVERYGLDWHMRVARLPREFAANQREAVRTATAKASRGLDVANVARRRVIPELGAGFWVAMFSRAIAHRLGFAASLVKVFPDRAMPQVRDVHAMANRIRLLRNRIAHHEPIVWMDLRTSHFELLLMLEGLSKSIHACFVADSELAEAIHRLDEFRSRL